MPRSALALLGMLLAFPASLAAQTFNSGSTGADGALDLAAMACTTCEVQLPPSGVLNYTMVHIPAGKTLKFKKNALNTPVHLLAQGSVTIAGIIDVSNIGVNLHGDTDVSIPGPGGFPGAVWTGDGDRPGLGPGGGVGVCGPGRWVGAMSLVPIIGGSGGSSSSQCSSGTGGGGAILVASSSAIMVTSGGGIRADGNTNWQYQAPGSGGAIRLVANYMSLAGSLSAYGAAGNAGLIRLEAPLDALSFTGWANPVAVISSINRVLFASASPTLSIVSVGGFAVPTYAGNRKDAADLVLPSQLTDPINIVVQASNIPPGSQVGVLFGGGTGTATPGTLVGTFEGSTATASVSGLNRNGLTYLYVQTVFALPQGGGGANPPGPDQVAQVKISAPPGGKPTFAFLRADGTEIPAARLSGAFLSQYQQ
jgi:hypothetical protein